MRSLPANNCGRFLRMKPTAAAAARVWRMSGERSPNGHGQARRGQAPDETGLAAAEHA